MRSCPIFQKIVVEEETGLKPVLYTNAALSARSQLVHDLEPLLFISLPFGAVSVNGVFPVI